MNFESPMSRRRFAKSLTLAGFASTVPALYAQGKVEKSKIIISVDGKAAFAYLPLTIADQLGFFRDEALDVQINDYSDASSADQALLTGAADICSGSFERILNLQSKNQMLKAFVLQSRTPQLAFGVSTRNLSAYTSMENLRGKKIGVVSLDSAASLMTNLLLLKAGLSPQDVNLVPSGSPAGVLSAIRSGQIDALCTTDPVMTMLEQKADVKIISDTRTLRGASELFGGSMPSACLYGSAEFVQKNPNICQALTHAIVHSLKWLQTAGPGDLIKVVPESYLLGDRALYLASFNKIRQCTSLDGLLPEDGPSTALKALSRFDYTLQQVKIDLSKSYTNIFALRSKERFKV
jgi:NitT/TauT family transport system substrate-binding protein